MNQETFYRSLFFLSFIAMMAIRLYYQSKILRAGEKLEVQEGAPSIVAGSLAALITIIFGAEYILSPGTFKFAYVLHYPAVVRWLGVLILAGGIAILWSSHHHLGISFHSLIVSKEDQELVQTGPYARIRHPIYTAYILSYIGGGFLASNIVLTIIPVACYAVLVGLRMPKEEDVLKQKFGEQYITYMEHTGRLVPKFRPRT